MGTGVLNAALDSPSSVSIFYQDAFTTVTLVLVAQFWVPKSFFEVDEQLQAADVPDQRGTFSKFCGLCDAGLVLFFCMAVAMGTTAGPDRE